MSFFYNHYDDLRSIETASPTQFLPLHWGNGLAGNTYGFEAWSDIQILPGWRVSPGLRTLHKDLHFKQGAAGILGTAQAGDDPSFQAQITSSADLPLRLSFYTSLRYVGELLDPRLPRYFELDMRLGWRVTPQLDVALVGKNLLQARHLEYPAPSGEEIPRSILAQARWQF